MSLPETLVVIPLEEKVLLPSVVMKLTIRGREAITLARNHFNHVEQRKTIYVACIPFIQSTSPSAHQSEDDQDYDGFVKHSEKNRLHNCGCVARILRVHRSGLGVYTITLEGVARFSVKNISQDSNGPVMAKVKYFPPPSKEELDVARDQMIAFKALTREFLLKMRDLQLPDTLTQQLEKLIDNVSPVMLADTLVSVIETSFDEKLWMLSATGVKERIEKASEWITRQMHVLKISEQIHSTIEGKLSKKQREFYLRQQLDAIRQELGEMDGSVGGRDEDDLTVLSRKLSEVNLPKEASIVAQRELKRIKKLQPSSSEWSVARNFLELMSDLPWNVKSEETLELARAKHQLESDHYGLEQIKKRIIEYLSVVKIKGDLKAPIICFVGPPGVGKTSLGKSIATALSREFHRISLGGVRDEADMRGHRRTYVGAMPGMIIQGLRKCGVNNPVMLLDEIDKLMHSPYYGDPAAAMLEVLDPEQNHSFLDHYLSVPFDLSNVVFIATANSIDTIPGPLLDRMEVIHLSGYTFEEKLHIAHTHLLPKQMRAHGLSPDQLTVDNDVILKIAENYTRESGVRNLERTLASVVRAKCVELAELHEKEQEDQYVPAVKLDDVEKILGVATFENEAAEREPSPGVVTGLAYSGSGNGGILFVESTKMPGKGDLQLTGSLGDVIKESAQIALSWVKGHAHELHITPTMHTNLVDKYDVHIHVPGGAVPKDGPSAGVTLTCSLVSLFTGLLVPPTTAMTGEISLRGQVLPVGGIKEKVISAHRAGIRKIILPVRNRKDVDIDVPKSVRNEIEFVYAKTIWHVLEAALEVEGTEKWVSRTCESHL